MLVEPILNSNHSTLIPEKDKFSVLHGLVKSLLISLLM